MNATSSHQAEILPLVQNQKIVIPKPKLALVENKSRKLLITRFVSYTKNTFFTVRLLSLTPEAEILCRDLESGNNVTIQLQVISPEKVLPVFPGEKFEFPIKFKMPKSDNSIELDELICNHIVNREKPVIWLSGAPGCGKSVLVNRIIERLNSGEFNAVSDYYKKVYAIKLSAQDYIVDNARKLRKEINTKIEDEYNQFKTRSKCIDDGECGFFVVFDEIDFVANVDRMLTIFEAAMELLGSMIGVVVFVDIFPFDDRAERSKDIMEILEEKFNNNGGLRENMHEFVVPTDLSLNQFNSVLDKFPLNESLKEDIRNKVAMQCKGQPLLSMDLLRKVLVDSYHGQEINLDRYINDMNRAVTYLLIEKTIKRADSVIASSPRPTQNHMELLRQIAKKSRCTGYTDDRNASTIKLFKFLDVIEKCGSNSYKIKSPTIKEFLLYNHNRT